MQTLQNIFNLWLNWKAHLSNSSFKFSKLSKGQNCFRQTHLRYSTWERKVFWPQLQMKNEEKKLSEAKYPTCIFRIMSVFCTKIANFQVGPKKLTNFFCLILAKTQTTIFSCLWGFSSCQTDCPFRFIIAWFWLAFVAHVFLVLDHSIHQKLDTIFDHHVVLKPQNFSNQDLTYVCITSFLTCDHVTGACCWCFHCNKSVKTKKFGHH